MNAWLNFDFVSKYRTELMGVAIFWIFFYHTGVDIPILHGLFSVGWIGVEIFFFVSGFGLCASLQKNPSTGSFYKRRLVRILPTWWLILGAMNIIGVRLGG
jgi:peptidoglycan/LPS O-acetylase OafA/YrhL